MSVRLGKAVEFNLFCSLFCYAVMRKFNWLFEYKGLQSPWTPYPCSPSQRLLLNPVLPSKVLVALDTHRVHGGIGCQQAERKVKGQLASHSWLFGLLWQCLTFLMTGACFHFLWLSGGAPLSSSPIPFQNAMTEVSPRAIWCMQKELLLSAQPSGQFWEAKLSNESCLLRPVLPRIDAIDLVCGRPDKYYFWKIADV